MNRNDLQKLAGIRLREAKTLYKAFEYSGAYYLAGYSIECALKAVIARRTQQYDFPDKQLVSESYTHDLTKLIGTAKLGNELLFKRKSDPLFSGNCSTLFAWSERSRYIVSTEDEARDILGSIDDQEHGVLIWIIQYW